MKKTPRRTRQAARHCRQPPGTESHNSVRNDLREPSRPRVVCSSSGHGSVRRATDAVMRMPNSAQAPKTEPTSRPSTEVPATPASTRARGANVLSDEYIPPSDKAPDPPRAVEAVNAAAEDALAKWGSGYLATDALRDRIEAMQMCVRDWERIGKAIPPSQCVELFYALCWAPDIYRRHAAETPRTASARAAHLADALLGELTGSQSVPGLSQPDRRLAIRLLRSMANGGNPGHTGVSRATPPRPTRGTALQTFTVRLIASFLRKFTRKPMYAAVAGLATAATFDPEFPDRTVSEGSVRKAYAVLKRELPARTVPK